jgi:hypothetical protein
MTPDNITRAQRAIDTIEFYLESFELCPESALTDLLADLRHLYPPHVFEGAAEMSLIHFNEETS